MDNGIIRDDVPQGYLLTAEEIAAAGPAELDMAGFIASPADDINSLRHRAASVRRAEAQLAEELERNGRAVLFDDLEVTPDMKICPGLVEEEGGALTQQLYSFRMGGVPGFFLSENLGWFFGGCLVWGEGTDDGKTASAGPGEGTLAVFLLRKSFRERRRFFVYDRSELLAHELCHAARRFMDDGYFEEYFAYRTGKGRSLRKLLGGVFRSGYDAALFAVPAMILPVAQAVKNWIFPGLPVWPFWIFAAAGPGYLLFSALQLHLTVKRASQTLRRFGKAENPGAVLFRLPPDEIKALARMCTEAEWRKFDAAHSGKLYWETVKERFLTHP